MLSTGQCSCIYTREKIYSRTSTNGHLSTTVTFYVPANKKSIPWLLFKAFHNSHFSTTATATKAWPQVPKKHLDNGQYSQLLMKKPRMVTKFDSYGTLMINRGIGILIVLHLHCSSKYKLSTILIANVVNLARFVSFKFWFKTLFTFFMYFISLYIIIYDQAIIIGYSKYDYNSFKLFLCSWLATITRIIHHNQLLLTKFGRILPYWTDNVKSAAKLQII